MTEKNPEDRLISWNYFEGLIQNGVPAVEVIKGSPPVQLFTDPAGARIGIRLVGDWESMPPIPLVSISVEPWTAMEPPGVEISTSNRNLYPDFFAFAVQLADRVQIRKMVVGDAVSDALEAMAALLGRLSILDADKQIGLLGEIWLLETLAARRTGNSPSNPGGRTPRRSTTSDFRWRTSK